MAKKNPNKKIFENIPIESTEANDESTESVPAEAENEVTSSEENLPAEEIVETPPLEEQPTEEVAATATSQEAEETSLHDLSVQNLPSEEAVETPPLEEQSTEEVAATATKAETEATSSDDLLEDVRRSLIEEESDKSKKESKWWRRMGRKGKKPAQEETPAPMEIDLPADTAATDLVEEQVQQAEPAEEADDIDELINMLAAEQEETAVETPETQKIEVPVEPVPEVDIEKLKEQAFRPATEEEQEKISDVRSVALGEGGEEVFVEVQPQVVDPWEERLKGFENALRPYRRYIYTALALLGVAMATVAALIIFNAYKQASAPPASEVSNLPYPTSVSLPGGWSFALGRGRLQNGQWQPQGAEWLEGTEVCRWVALPWSRQLEAVIRTLNPKDPIDLFMSNNDKLVYQVYSVRQLSPEEMQKLDSNTPCLLLILAQPDSPKRWVLTALP